MAKVHNSKKKITKSGKERILDAAEELFGMRGYSGTSMREIARRASVELGLTTYHFGGKDELFRSVVGRRAGILCNQLIASLTEAETAAKDPEIRDLIDAYIAPYAQHMESGDSGWRSYIKLAGHTAILEERDDLTAPLREQYVAVEIRYLRALYQALPGAQRSHVDAAFYVFRLTVTTVAGEGGWRGSTRTRATERSIPLIRETLVDVFAPGFLALTNSS